MSAFHYHAPCDPECPGYQQEVQPALDDPMTQYYGMGDEIGPLLESKHMKRCARCQAFGAENIEVIGP